MLSRGLVIWLNLRGEQTQGRLPDQVQKLTLLRPCEPLHRLRTGHCLKTNVAVNTQVFEDTTLMQLARQRPELCAPIAMPCLAAVVQTEPRFRSAPFGSNIADESNLTTLS